MKNLIILAVAVSVASAFAGTPGFASQGERLRVRETIFFPGHGEVPANLVCLSGQDTLKTTVPAQTVQRCVRVEIDHSDSTRPVQKCIGAHYVEVPAQPIEAPMEYTAWECIDVKVDHSDSTRPVSSCLKYGEVRKIQSLTYYAETFRLDDYRQETPRREKRTIERCQ